MPGGKEGAIPGGKEGARTLGVLAEAGGEEGMSIAVGDQPRSPAALTPTRRPKGPPKPSRRGVGIWARAA